MKRAVAAAIVLGAVAGALSLGIVRKGRDEGARCGPGFDAHGARCMPDGPCPAPLAASPHGCDAPDVRVLVPAGALAMGASDWEAEGLSPSRSIRVQAYRIDAFELTRGAMGASRDVARAASDLPRADAAALCASRGGRLPTEDEWIYAAASAANPPRRYPWGDTGAVCRRAAWGLSTGPCAERADGPDTVGSHADGDSPLGLHDVAGDVAEWVSDDAPRSTPAAPLGIAKGGSWATSLAADLRIWARLELQPARRGIPGVGVRCVYPP